MNLEEIEKRMNFVVTTNADKMPERIEAAEVILREDVSSLISEVKRLREENEWLKEDIKRFESFRQPQSTVHKDW